MLNETQRQTLGEAHKQLVDYLLKRKLTRLIALAVQPMSETCAMPAAILLFMHAQAKLVLQLSADVKMPSEVRTALDNLSICASAFAALYASNTKKDGETVCALLSWLNAPSQRLLDAVCFFNPIKSCFFFEPTAGSGQWYALATNETVERKPQSFFAHATLRVVGSTEQLASFDAACAQHDRGPNVFVAQCLRVTPNYNPACLLDMAFFTAQVAAAPELARLADTVKAESVSCLVHLRELFLEMTPMADYTYGVDYSVFTFRIGTCPLNLNGVGPTPEPGEIGREVARCVTNRLEEYAELLQALRDELAAGSATESSSSSSSSCCGAQGDEKEPAKVTLPTIAQASTTAASFVTATVVAQNWKARFGETQRDALARSCDPDLERKQVTVTQISIANRSSSALDDELFSRVLASRRTTAQSTDAPKVWDGVFVLEQEGETRLLSSEFEHAIVLGSGIAGETSLYARRTLRISPVDEFALCCEQAKLGDPVATNNLALFFCVTTGQLGFPADADERLALEILQHAIATGSASAANNYAFVEAGCLRPPGVATASKNLVAALRKLTCLPARHNLAMLTQDRRAIGRLAPAYAPSAFVCMAQGLNLPRGVAAVSVGSWAILPLQAGLYNIMSSERRFRLRGLAVLQQAAESWDRLALLFLTGISPFPIKALQAVFKKRASGFLAALDRCTEACLASQPHEDACESRRDFLAVSCLIEWRQKACHLDTEKWCARALAGACVESSWLLGAARAFLTLRLKRAAGANVELVLRELAEQSPRHVILLADYLSCDLSETQAFDAYLRVARAHATKHNACFVGDTPLEQDDANVILSVLRSPRIPVFAACETTGASRSDLECVLDTELNANKMLIVAQRTPSCEDDCTVDPLASDTGLMLKMGEVMLRVHARSPDKRLVVMAAIKEPIDAISNLFTLPCCQQYSGLADGSSSPFGCSLSSSAEKPHACSSSLEASASAPTQDGEKPSRVCVRTQHGEHVAWSAEFWAGYPSGASIAGFGCVVRGLDHGVRAMVAVARRLDTGVGVKQDGLEALTWWRRAASAGNSDAQFELGLAYRGGRRGARKHGAQTVAKEWFEAAAAQGHANAKLALQDTTWTGSTAEASASDASSSFFSNETLGITPKQAHVLRLNRISGADQRSTALDNANKTF